MLLFHLDNSQRVLNGAGVAPTNMSVANFSRGPFTALPLSRITDEHINGSEGVDEEELAEEATYLLRGQTVETHCLVMTGWILGGTGRIINIGQLSKLRIKDRRLVKFAIWNVRTMLPQEINKSSPDNHQRRKHIQGLKSSTSTYMQGKSCLLYTSRCV